MEHLAEIVFVTTNEDDTETFLGHVYAETPNDVDLILQMLSSLPDELAFGCDIKYPATWGST